MSPEERRKLGMVCEICGDLCASEILGGLLLDGRRGLFLVCLKCKNEVKDERKKKAEKNKKENIK